MEQTDKWTLEQNKSVVYRYIIDKDVCKVCIDSFSKEKIKKYPCELTTFYNKSTGRDQLRCKGIRTRSEMELISLLACDKNNEKFKTHWIINLYPVILESLDQEEISLGLVEGYETGKIFKKFIGCDYDPHHELELSAENMKKLIASIPLYNDGVIPDQEKFGLELNIVDGDKVKWLRDYQKKFEGIKNSAEGIGHLVEPQGLTMEETLEIERFSGV